MNSNESPSANITKEDHFAFLLNDNPIRNISIVFGLIHVFIIPILLYSIIWYEKYGTDNRRTILNMLMSSLCWILIEVCFTIELTEVFRFTYGPFPKYFCFLKTIVRGAFTTQVLLYIDAVAIVRYILIFWLKNPSAFKDEFWSMFISIWIRVFCLLYTTVRYSVADRQLINYYICSGIDPTEDFKKSHSKTKGIVEALSLIINIFIYLRVQVYKKSNKDKPATQKKSDFLKRVFLADLKNQSLTSFSTNIMTITIMVLMFFNITYLSGLKPEEIPNHESFLFLHYLVVPCVMSFLFVLIHYTRYEPLRRVVSNEIRNTFLIRYFRSKKKNKK
jgi:hypothetical protein